METSFARPIMTLGSEVRIPLHEAFREGSKSFGTDSLRNDRCVNGM